MGRLSKLRRIIGGVKFDLDFEYEDIEQCKQAQFEYRMEGTQVRRVKTEYNTYQLYTRSEKQ